MGYVPNSVCAGNLEPVAIYHDNQSQPASVPVAMWGEHGV